MWFRSMIITYLILLFSDNYYAFKPVFIIHGIKAGAEPDGVLPSTIKKYHVGTETYATALFDFGNSTKPMDEQVRGIGEELLNFSKKYPDGVHVVGHSQGALIGRAILEYFPDHNVQNFISLAGPQAGFYGTSFLKNFLPEFHLDEHADLVHWFAYNDCVQELFSWANYWNDPHQQKSYYKHVHFLPSINNEINQTQSIIDDHTRGITKLKNFVVLGGSDDEMIEPWQSSIFGYYDANEAIVPMEKQNYYEKDLFGLRTLNEKKSLYVQSAPNIHHNDWVLIEELIVNYTLPWLD